MTLDQSISEEEALGLLGEGTEISHHTQISHGVFDSSTARFEHGWMAQICKLPDDILGMYLGVMDEVLLAIENVVVHGGRQIRANLKYNDKGVLITIEDDGKGFDVKSVLDAFFNSQQYFQIAGYGLKRMHESRATVFFNEKGTKTQVLYMPTIQERPRLEQLAGMYRVMQKFA